MALSTTNLVKCVSGVYRDDASRLTDLDLMASTINSVLWSGLLAQSQSKQEQINLATIALGQFGNEFVLAFNKHSIDDRKQAGLPDFTTLKQTEVPVLGRVASEAPYAGDTRPGDVASTAKRSVDIVTTVRQGDGGTVNTLRHYVPKFKTKDVVFSPRAQVRVILEEMLSDDFLTQLRGVKANKITVLKGPKKDSTTHAEMRLLRYSQDQAKSLRSIGVSKPCCHLCAEALDEAGVSFARWSVVKSISGWVPPAGIQDTQTVAI